MAGESLQRSARTMLTSIWIATVGYLILLALARSRQNAERMNQPRLIPLFDIHPRLDRNPGNRSRPTLHTSISTLLPILPEIASTPNPPDPYLTSTLLVTMATPGFKRLLLNFLCFLHHRVKTHPPGKYLVFTSSPELARWLSDRGVMVLLLGEGSEEFKAGKGRDAFSNLRLLDLLLPDSNPRAEMIQWGSLHYQSLMLERSAVVASLVGALAESMGSPPVPPSSTIDGVLLVDNDAVWLSSPTPFFSHAFRKDGNRPSIIFAPDAIPDSWTPWDESGEMPCACFVYARTSDPPSSTSDSDTRSSERMPPSSGAAQAWRYAALCHISNVLEGLETAMNSITQNADSMSNAIRAVAPSFQVSSLGPALYLASKGLLPDISHEDFMNAMGSGNMSDLTAMLEDLGLFGAGKRSCLVRAKEVSSSCLWTHDVQEKGKIVNGDLRRSNGFRIPPRTFSGSSRVTGPAAPVSHNSSNDVRRRRSPLGSPRRQAASIDGPVIVESLPHGLFPPGVSFFERTERQRGVQPIVVHANYALGEWKEKLLRQQGLWALVDPGPDEGKGDSASLNGEWSCDAGVLSSTV